MDFKKINFQVEENIATIQMNYLKNLNAIDEEMVNELEASFQACEKEEVKVIIIKGTERCFSAGGDIGYFYDRIKNNTLGEFTIVERVFKLSNYMRKFPKPIIASCSGAVAGAGCNLALSCDFVFCSDTVKFLQAFVNIALIPDTGGIYLLAKDIGWHRAMDLVMTGAPITAQEGHAMGMFKQVCSVEELDGVTLKFAKKLVAGPACAYRNMKKLMYEAVFKEYEDFGKAEVMAQVECSKTEDFKEGIAAFVEKRKANFKGK